MSLPTAFSPTSCCPPEDGTVRLWDLATKQALARILCGTQVTCVAFSADGKKLATARNSVKVWDVGRLLERRR